VSRNLKLLVRAVIVLLCLGYTLKGLDFQFFLATLTRYSIFKTSVLVGLGLVSILTGGLRLYNFSRGRARLMVCTKALVLGQALNNLLPVKMGEFAKLLYLSNNSRLEISRSLAVIFWERFYDLNALLLLALIATNYLVLPTGSFYITVLVLSIWIVLSAVKMRPALGSWIIDRAPFEKLRLFLVELQHHLNNDLTLGYQVRSACLTLLHWLLALLLTSLGLVWLAGFDLSAPQLLVVFVCSAVGLLLPSSPGGLGVYEAAMVAGLSIYGVPKEEALAIGLVIHSITYLPQTLLGGVIFLKSELSLKKIREAGETLEHLDGGGGDFEPAGQVPNK